MNKRTLLNATLLALILAVFTFGMALAHEHVPVGNYELVIGWGAEPPVAGQPNAITVRVEDTTATDKDKVIDISKLTASISYGGQEKTLELEPSFGTANEYEAHLIPAIAGTYTIKLRGKLGDTEVNVDVEPEEVVATETLIFPSAAPAQSSSAMSVDWLGLGTLVIALAALIVGLVALRKAK